MGRLFDVEALLRRDQLVVISGLALVTASAWAWTLASAGSMSAPGDDVGAMMGSVAMTMATWSLSYAALIFLMWWIMMAAMMLPTATPLLFLAVALHRRNRGHRGAGVTAGALSAGYVSVWGAFSLCATLVQWGLQTRELISPTTMAAGPALAGGIMVVAGLYQITPLKRACLTRCRSPVEFIAAFWQPGFVGAFRTGLVHGAFCLGCCWVLMGLLFVGGVMNPFWIGAIALYLLLEKLSPFGEPLSRASGLLLAGAGLATIIAATS